MDPDNSYRPHRIDKNAYAQKLQVMAAAHDTAVRPHDARHLRITAIGLIFFATFSQLAVLVAMAGYSSQGVILLVMAVLQIMAGVGLLFRKRIGYFLFNIVAAITIIVMLFLFPSSLGAIIVVVSVLGDSPVMAGLSLANLFSQFGALCFAVFGLFTLNSEPARALFR